MRPKNTFPGLQRGRGAEVGAKRGVEKGAKAHVKASERPSMSLLDASVRGAGGAERRYAARPGCERDRALAGPIVDSVQGHGRVTFFVIVTDDLEHFLLRSQDAAEVVS
ncbi:unnamed protein product, partial [Iphiclides podalirius]